MSIKSKVTGLLKKTAVEPPVTGMARVYQGREKATVLFAQFIDMEVEIRKITDDIQAEKEAALAEIAALQAVVAAADEEIAVQKAMADNLLQFINPGAGAMKATVAVDSIAVKLEEPYKVVDPTQFTEDETRG